MAHAPPGVRRSALFLIGNFGLGGAERQLFYLALGLRRRGWEVSVVSLSPLVHDPFVAAFLKEGVDFTVVQDEMRPGLGPMSRALRGALRLVRRQRPQAIVGFMPHGALFARVLGRIGRVPRVVTSLRSIRSTRPWHDRLLAATRSLDHVAVANSAAAAAAQTKDGVIVRGKAVVIHNGVEFPAIDRPIRSSDEPFRWLMVAVFRGEKGHDVLLRAVRIVSRRMPMKLLLVGEGTTQDATRSLARELGIDGLVEFLGKRTDVDRLIAASDAFVLPSRWESLPNALVEALAGRLPAVATDVGGSPEVLEDGISGFLVPPNDPEALADAMLRMMDLPAERRAAMGEAGCRHVQSSFGMEAMVAAWEQLLLGGAAGEQAPGGRGRR